MRIPLCSRLIWKKPCQGLLLLTQDLRTLGLALVRVFLRNTQFLACQQGTLSPFGHLVPSPFGGLHMLWLLRPVFTTLHRINDRTELDLHRMKRGFQGAFATGVACQQGTLTLPDTLFRSPFWDLLMLQLLRPNSSNLPCPYSTLHLEYPFCLKILRYEIQNWLVKFCWKKVPFDVLSMKIYKLK